MLKSPATNWISTRSTRLSPFPSVDRAHAVAVAVAVWVVEGEMLGVMVAI